MSTRYLWGKLPDGSRIKLAEGMDRPENVSCPQCAAEFIPHMGEIKQWHFQHKSAVSCDTWNRGESDWHLEWKRKFPDYCCEVVMGPHRADVRTLDGIVIEFQNSPISPEEIRERETFYGRDRMIWIFNAMDWTHARRELPCCDWGDHVAVKGEEYECGRCGNRYCLRLPDITLKPYESQYGQSYTASSFLWLYAKKYVLTCRAPVLIDLGTGILLLMRKMRVCEDKPGRVAGWGELRNRQAWLEVVGNGS